MSDPRHLAHEVRTPLHGVLASVARLLETELTREQRSHVETIREATAALVALADASLGIAPSDADGDATVSDVGAIARGVHRLLAPTAEAKGLTLDVHVADDLPVARAAAGRVRQVLLNLVGNAVKFTTHGGVAVAVRRVDDRVRVEIADSGPGLTPVEQIAVFRAHARGVGSSHVDGVGLGLAIAAEIVRDAGGTIGVRSNAGPGVTFWLELPIDPAALRVAAGALAGVRVLVVDDDAVGRRVTAEALARHGCAVRVAAGVDDAVRALAQPCDVVLLDWELGDGTAADVVAHARAHATMRDVPIVGLTADADAAARGRCLALGMMDCLCKPLAPAALARAVARWAPPRGVAPPAAPRASETIDTARLEALARLEGEVPGLLARVATDYAREAARLLTELDGAVRAADAAAVARTAHALRGSSATAGAARAAVLAEAIERAARHGVAQPVDESVHRIDALRDAVEAAATTLARLAGGARAVLGAPDSGSR